MLEEVVHRAKQIEGVSRVIVAVPDKDSRILYNFMGEADGFFAGSETDVLNRYYCAAKIAQADIIVRITADCPMLAPNVSAEVLDKLVRHRPMYGYVSNSWPTRTYPHGWDTEAFTMEALDAANAFATDPYDREHVTPWMQKTDQIAKSSIRNLSNVAFYRWTLDTIGDYRRIYQVMNEAGSDHRAA